MRRELTVLRSRWRLAQALLVHKQTYPLPQILTIFFIALVSITTAISWKGSVDPGHQRRQ